MQAGVFQICGGGLTVEERLSRLNAVLSKQSLDLVVCPELFMSGYNIGDNLDRFAEPIDGPFAAKVAELARSHGVAIVYGYPERADGEIFNAAACFGPNGTLLANHRKLLLPPGFEARYFSKGQGVTVFNLGGLRCAILICYDTEYPESVRAAAEAGAQAILVPTALVDNWPVVAYQVMPARAFENGVWLLYANHCGVENGASYLGASCIIAPDGHDAVRAGSEEVLIRTEIDTIRVTAAQKRLPYLDEVGELRLRLSSVS